MAAHRKPKQRTLTGSTARTAFTLALAGAASATAFEGTSVAEPALTPAQVKAKVDQLYHDAEVATEKYNGVRETVGDTRESLGELRDEAARRTERLNASRNALGSLAAAQYRTGAVDPAVQIALSSDPDQYLERAARADRAGDRHAAAITGVRQQLGAIDQLRSEADTKLANLTSQQSDLKKHKSKIQGKIADAEALLSRLTAEDRARYAEQDGHGAAAAPRANREAPRGGAATAPNARAAQAVSFARGALGAPYVWGATGPSSFDCSGLTQAAWRAAGVSLPRTTYTQINAGSRVPRSQLAPGDLVFFYSGISHVGLYIGDGQMIHAPRPGAPVRVAPIDQMPFAGASRPA
ncbi:C40 family peptidase [Streptomyces sp. H27-C3]|uniref:C40 family peptidase n=1 Tax=Streptomyces sp. H27-C3 TaxID=3046305 RepID=UPI0024B96B8F|nr:C40 family peptidase [Streptomyces sp. H27-C3]MDJ0464022.1 NlpC/P60 family protein [Streptomyces sp. H27-C3]